jgi:membrane-associated phospholipid phosphatase
VVPERRLAPKISVIPIEHPRLRGYNPVDIITGAYMALTGILLAIGRERVPHASAYLLIHVLAVTGIALLHFIPRRGNVLLMFIRDTYPLWALPFFYHEVRVLDRLIWSGFFDPTVMGWEKAIFGLYPSLHLHEWLPNRLFNEFFHFSYFAYYFLVPILGLWLYLRGREELCRVFGTTILLTFFTCYIIYIFFPVAGPYYVFPPSGNSTGFFPPLVHRILESGASKGAAFPSSHVAASIVVFCMALRFDRRLAGLMGVIAAGILVGTVYGGFHYAIDALVGLVLGVSLALLGPSFHSFLLRRARLSPMRIRFPHLVDPLIAKLWGRRPRSENNTSRSKSAS